MLSNSNSYFLTHANIKSTMIKDLVKNLRNALINPKKFFLHFEPTFEKVLLLVSIPLFLSTTLSFLFSNFHALKFFPFFPLIFFCIVVYFSIAFHFTLLVLDGNPKFVNTFASICISSIPSLLVSWIPHIGIFLCLAASIYGIYIFLVGLTTLHKISMEKALITFIVGIIVSGVGLVLIPLISIILMTLFLWI